MIIPVTRNKKRRYVLVSKKTGRVLGTHKTMAEAKAQEHAINISKARAAGHRIPFTSKRKARQ